MSGRGSIPASVTPAAWRTPAGVLVTASDLFSGAGGSTEGLTQAGLRVVVAANHWPLAVATHQANHPDTEHRIANLSEVDWRSDRATAYAVIAAAEVHAYPVIFVENLPEFRDWVLYGWWLDGLAALGYTIRELILDAADFGHAQYCKRWFLVATRDGIELDLTPPTVAPVTASEILDPDPGRPVTRRLYVADQIDSITDEGVPHLVTYRRHAKARRADRHPIATVTAGGNHHAVAQVIDGAQYHRLLNNRERARAQGFPDAYEFRGSSDDVRRQIGNAVPVGIARWLGERARSALTTPTEVAA